MVYQKLNIAINSLVASRTTEIKIHHETLSSKHAFSVKVTYLMNQHTQTIIFLKIFLFSRIYYGKENKYSI